MMKKFILKLIIFLQFFLLFFTFRNSDTTKNSENGPGKNWQDKVLHSRPFPLTCPVRKTTMWLTESASTSSATQLVGLI